MLIVPSRCRHRQGLGVHLCAYTACLVKPQMVRVSLGACQASPHRPHGDWLILPTVGAEGSKGQRVGCRMAQTSGSETALDNLEWEPRGWTQGNLPAVRVCQGPDTLGSCRLHGILACPPSTQPQSWGSASKIKALSHRFVFFFFSL